MIKFNLKTKANTIFIGLQKLSKGFSDVFFYSFSKQTNQIKLQLVYIFDNFNIEQAIEG